MINLWGKSQIRSQHGPAVKNPPSNAGDAGLIPDPGTKIPHARAL